MGLFGGSDSDSEEDISSERADKLVNDREHRGITKEKLTERINGEGYTYTSVINHLGQNEDAVAIVRGRTNSVKIGRKEKSPDKKGEILYVLTDRRLIIIIPEEGADSVEEVSYDDIENIEGETKSSILTKNYRLVLQTTNKKYRLDMPDSSPLYFEYTFVDILREKVYDDYECVIASPQYENMSQIEVIDRETGEAKMESKGWNYGISFIERTKSDSVIEKEGYEMEAVDIVIKSNHLLMEAIQPNGGRVTIRRKYEDIGTVDETSSGFIAYCSDGIYKIDCNGHSDRKSKIQNAIRNKVENTVGEKRQKGESELDKLEKLAELKDDGVLTEEEFEQKKEELLDEI